ncbi:MAG: hypothetical protein TR69_WS6001000986 [candidate division WS6 bacterium OLB20]|uniref:Uncharacterized protein n=1 Tax=candidate division WS6 bacterium OLB20 TaxID=1617426 RepID=A0A136LZ92_9BACT|nr:MAG: hypothetical protein TR69_WS6001000986 [candidate division WS6 bacterium OLB20]
MKNAKKILLVTRKNPDFDAYISLQLLAEVIKQDLNKPVELACEAELPKQYEAVFPMPEIKRMKELPPKSFVLEFKNQENKVQNIQWNQAEDKLTLFLTMQQGDLNASNLNVQIAGTNHDLIMLIGVNSFDELGELYSKSRSIFDEARVVAFGTNPQIRQQNVKVVQGDKATSLSEQVFAYLESNGIKISEDRANRVLTGIFHATKNFKQNVTSAQTYETAARLTKIGATNETASTALARTASDAADKAKSQAQSAQKPSDQQSRPAQGQTGSQQGSQPGMKPATQNQTATQSSQNQKADERSNKAAN